MRKKNMNFSSALLIAVLGSFLIGGPQTADATFLSSFALPTQPNAHLLSPARDPAPIWLVFLPSDFQNAPGPASHAADTHDLNPLGKSTPPEQKEAHQSGIRFERCLDTDKCLFMRPGKGKAQNQRMMVELFGIDVPHIHQSCEQEKVLATAALKWLERVLQEASQIDIYDHYQVGGKHLARVVVDGQDLSELLLSQGLAAPKGQGKKNWCID